MKIAKRFRWEAAHRLPWHEGDCRFVHGHSYRMMVELTGEPDERGMLLDFKHLKRLLKPLIDAFDHATLVAENDDALLQSVQSLGSKVFVLPFDSTAENLCTYVADHLESEGARVLRGHGITALRVTVWETETCYAELHRTLSHAEGQGGDGQAAESRPTLGQPMSA
jgi:6-pyruvoyltetrahydropterin/6-carboxytetrahydropterin synthase